MNVEAARLLESNVDNTLVDDDGVGENAISVTNDDTVQQDETIVNDAEMSHEVDSECENDDKDEGLGACANAKPSKIPTLKNDLNHNAKLRRELKRLEDVNRAGRKQVTSEQLPEKRSSKMRKQ